MPHTKSIRGTSNIIILHWTNWLGDNIKGIQLYFQTFTKKKKRKKAFSMLTIVKTKLRSIMTQERHDSFMLIFIEQNISTELTLNKSLKNLMYSYPKKEYRNYKILNVI